MATSSRRSSGPVLGFGRSSSPSGRYCSSSSSPSASSSGFASSSSSFSSKSPGFYYRSTSPTRVRYGSTMSSSPSVRFSIVDRSISPSRSISAMPRDNRVVKKQKNPLSAPQKKTCMCSPTNHPGSFRCSLHKNINNNNQAASYTSNRLNARRSAMANSLVRIGTVEGDLVKRALAALIRPSSHSQRRRAAFQPRLSRLSIMSKASDDL
ncbi:hypothetical protein ACHQM5_028915 [Ranunculus cassubicifolius]